MKRRVHIEEVLLDYDQVRTPTVGELYPPPIVIAQLKVRDFDLLSVAVRRAKDFSSRTYNGFSTDWSGGSDKNRLYANMSKDIQKFAEAARFDIWNPLLDIQVTFDSKVVQPGSQQRFGSFHSDGAWRTVTGASRLNTLYAYSDEPIYDNKIKPRFICFQPPDGAMVEMDDKTLHKSTTNSEPHPVARHFLRFSIRRSKLAHGELEEDVISLVDEIQMRIDADADGLLGA